MRNNRLPSWQAWPAIAAALLYGLIEWLALTRSRVCDRLQQARHAVRRE
jgi:hypothetical protein